MKAIILLSLLTSFLVCALASAADHPDYEGFSAPKDFLLVDTTLRVNDTVVYGTGYYSVNGSAFQPFSFSGDAYPGSDDWLLGEAIYTLPNFGVGEHYVLVYTCTYSGGWDCHGGKWQLRVIDNLSLPSEGTLYLVQEGVALADIVISPEAPNTVIIAADELQYFVNQMSGAMLPINNDPDPSYDFHVYIGQSDYAVSLGVTADGCEHGSFKMVSGDDFFVLLGNEYHIPVLGPHTTISRNSHRAAVVAEWDAITGEYWDTPYDMFFKKYSANFDLWDAERRGTLNAVYEFLYDQGVRWYYPGVIGEVIPSKQDITIQAGVDKHVIPDFSLRTLAQYNNDFFFVDEDELKWQYRLRITPNSGDHIIGLPEAHGMNEVTSRDEVKAAHPEYYAIWYGEVMNGDRFIHDMCSEGLYNQTVKYIKTIFDVYDPPAMSIMPSDGLVKASERYGCDEKSTPERGEYGSLSDYVWEFVNRAAWELYEEYPDKMITCLAYGAYTLPPTTINELAPNLMVGVAQYRGGYAKNPANEAFFQGVVDSWLDILPSKQIYIREYYLYNRHEREYYNIPVYFPHTIDRDIKYFNNKLLGEYVEINRNWPAWNLSWDPYAANALNIYISTRLYWDVDQDVDALLDEYYDLYYGPAAGKMQQLIEYSERYALDATTDPDVLPTMQRFAQEARATAGDTIYGERIDLIIAMLYATQ